jgi:tetratricopeptide (TPR) repeat protein
MVKYLLESITDMKRFSILLLAGVFSLSGLAFGQAAEQQPSLRTRVKSSDLPSGGATDIFVVGGNRGTILYKLNTVQVDPMQLPFNKFEYFYMMEPPEYLSALESFQNNKLQEARAKFAAFKDKYKAILAVPDNYVQKAAFLELECAIEMQDWPAVAALYKAFPRQATPPAEMIVSLEAIEPLSKLDAKAWADVISATGTMQKQKNKWSLKDSARIAYARGVALAATGKPQEALDEFARTIVAEHGAYSPLASAALLQSVDILAADPKVVEFMKHEPQKSNFAKAPQAFRDAAAFVYLHKNVLFPEIKMDPKYDAFLNGYETPTERVAREGVRPKPQKEETPKEAGKPAAPAKDAKTAAPAKAPAKKNSGNKKK